MFSRCIVTNLRTSIAVSRGARVNQFTYNTSRRSLGRCSFFLTSPDGVRLGSSPDSGKIKASRGRLPRAPNRDALVPTGEYRGLDLLLNGAIAGMGQRDSSLNAVNAGYNTAPEHLHDGAACLGGAFSLDNDITTAAPKRV